jgi:uncharacterized protein YwgA
MFNRQKIVINILDMLQDGVSSLKLQKLLYLYSEENCSKKRLYDFVPYNYGCYSFTLHKDQIKLEKEKFIDIQRFNDSRFSFISLNKDSEIPKITNVVKQSIKEFIE